MKVNNIDAAYPLTPLTAGAHSLFNKVRVLVSGVEVESIDYYGRTVSMLDKLLPAEKRFNEALMGFGFNGGTFAGSDLTASNIAASGSRVVIHRPPTVLGLCSQPKWIPLFALGH